MTADEVRSHPAGLALANGHEITELRAATVELKLQQLWALMISADLFEDPAQRDLGAQIVRDRWNRLYQAKNV